MTIITPKPAHAMAQFIASKSRPGAHLPFVVELVAAAATPGKRLICCRCAASQRDYKVKFYLLHDIVGDGGEMQSSLSFFQGETRRNLRTSSDARVIPFEWLA